ncbi:uncharacterized protein N7482_004808 [Penicillium canariense]|uniref:F-box domain-containing protein n=1 Tax=Penicillium canariense TaxID=189055 RepID=A0A9W9I711_9EURO|nr:uncharacterized protein N7482_004808 [Penicillium canariense]KAJ5169214.1 hypothetical protein N7482_004808 [Penicillium canariense]
MSLSQLPTETLWTIASYLPLQSDIYALVRINRRLHQGLEKCLYYWNAQYNHGSALFFAAKHSLIPQIQTLLDGLVFARTLPHSHPWKETRATRQEENEESEEEEESEEDLYPIIRRRNLDGRLDLPILIGKMLVGIQTGNTEAVQVLLQFGAEVNFYRGSRVMVDIDDPPLFTAVQYGHVEMVNKLLEGADPQRYTPSPLYRAVKDGRRDLISALLKSDVRSQKAALKLAVLRRDYPMVEFLLSGGLNTSECGHAGLYVAEMKGYKDITTLLKLRGATIDALSEADKMNWATEDKDGTGRPKYYTYSTLMRKTNLVINSVLSSIPLHNVKQKSRLSWS